MANETDPLIDLVQQDDSYPAPLLRAIKGYHNLAGINERTRLSIDFSFDYQNKSFFRDLLALVTLAEENEKIIFDLAWLNDNLEQIRLKESLNGEDIQKLKEICARANEDPEYLLGHISIHINHNLGRQTDLLIKAYLYTIASVAVSGGVLALLGYMIALMKATTISAAAAPYVALGCAIFGVVLHLSYLSRSNFTKNEYERLVKDRETKNEDGLKQSTVQLAKTKIERFSIFQEQPQTSKNDNAPLAEEACEFGDPNAPIEMTPTV